MGRLGWATRPTQVHELQAAAAVGQMGLAQIYQTSFNVYGLSTAQILLTHADFADRERYLNARSTLQTLLSLGVIPIINENDTVATDEIKFGDNDTLAALVSNLIDADALIILTDQIGVLNADPRYVPNATLISEAHAGDPELEKLAGGTGGPLGRGGMLTKILAAKRAAQLGAHTVIACGREDKVLVRLASGEAIGTQLLANTPVLSARKQWIANHLQMRGHVVIDEGAQSKLITEGKSLLPIGITEVKGEFTRGEVIACVTSDGKEVARGISNYSAAEARLIARQPSSEIEKILGYINEPELIHRNNLIVIC
jgi:glutamate 5-kinase